MPTPPPELAVNLLASVSYFQSLERGLLEAIARAATRREYDAGQLVLLEGEPAAGLYVVEKGRLKVSKMALEGREQILQLLGGGEVFNAVGVFAGSVNPATVTALEPATLWLIDRLTMLELLDRHPPLARWVIQDLAARVMNLIALVEDLSLRTVEARLARLLLEQSTGDVVLRRRWATQAELASRLGTVPDVVSRTLRRFAGQGLIELDRKEIRIRQRKDLETIAKIEPF